VEFYCILTTVCLRLEVLTAPDKTGCLPGSEVFSYGYYNVSEGATTSDIKEVIGLL
jgi:hypothetical protein